MATIGARVTREDVRLLCQRLNEGGEIAFLLPDGPGRWRAHKGVESLDTGEHALWHIPSGPLPLIGKDVTPKITAPPGVVVIPPRYVQPVVPDPWAGWQDPGPALHRKSPSCAGQPGVFTLSLILFEKGVGSATFEWIGSYFERAPEATEKWWKRLRAWFKKVGVKVGDDDAATGDEVVWALPGALDELTR